MSLKIYVDPKVRRVIVVRSFRDPKFNLDYSSGAFLQMDTQEFRKRALSLVCSHFEEYDRIRLLEKQVVQPFSPGEGKRLLKNSAALIIWKDGMGKFWLAPIRPQKGDPLIFKDLGPEYHRRLPENFTDVDFWKAFDEVLSLGQ